MFDAETDGRQETTRDDRSELMWIEKKKTRETDRDRPAR